MDKEYYFKENGFFAEDNDFLLRAPMETDREDYLKLCVEIFCMPNIYEDEQFKEILWQAVLKENLAVFIINKTNNEFCGYVVLKNYISDTPEIGIDLLKKYQNKGIGYRMVKLLMETTYKIHKVKYFIVRIYSDNLHSQNLYKKFGAVPLGREDSEYVTLLNSIKNYMKDDEINKLFEKYSPQCITENYIIRYRIDIPYLCK